MSRCYLRRGDDALANALAYSTVKGAVQGFELTARELDGYGQRIEATLHIAADREALREYPDYVLSLGPRGGLRRERA